jgi:hypothetical protein
MKTAIPWLAAFALLATSAVAQTPNTVTDSGRATGAANPPASSTTNGLVSGSNSFTEGQAKSRIESNGYEHVTGLKKDERGVWRGKATKDGKSVDVGLDFKGDVVSQ